MVTKHLLKYIEHGFHEKHSCLTQLLINYDIVLYFLEEGTNIDPILLDLSKALNKVDVRMLAHKIKECI